MTRHRDKDRVKRDPQLLSISKKDKNLQHKMKEMFFEKGHEQGARDNLLNYVWKEVNGKLVMQYVTVINLGDERTGDVAVIDGLEVGDKIVREVSAAVEED